MLGKQHVHPVDGKPGTFECTDHPEPVVFEGERAFPVSIAHELEAHPLGVPNGFEYAREWATFQNDFYGFDESGDATESAALVAWADQLRLKRQPVVPKEATG